MCISCLFVHYSNNVIINNQDIIYTSMYKENIAQIACFTIESILMCNTISIRNIRIFSLFVVHKFIHIYTIENLIFIYVQFSFCSTAYAIAAVEC